MMPLTSGSRRPHSVDVTSGARPTSKPDMPTRTGVPAASFLPSRLTRMTHADVPDGSPDPGRARPTRSFAAPTAHGRAHLSYPLLRQPPFSSPRPLPHLSSSPPTVCVRSASLQQQCLAWSGRVQAALARRMVPRGAGTTPVQRQVPVWAVSHVGSRDVLCQRLRIIDGGCSLGPRRGRLRASVLLDPAIL